jgi:hypothetical protein
MTTVHDLAQSDSSPSKSPSKSSSMYDVRTYVVYRSWSWSIWICRVLCDSIGTVELQLGIAVEHLLHVVDHDDFGTRDSFDEFAAIAREALGYVPPARSIDSACS